MATGFFSLIILEGLGAHESVKKDRDNGCQICAFIRILFHHDHTDLVEGPVNGREYMK